MIDDSVNRAVAAIEKPRDGRDGVGLAGSLIDRTGSLILTMTDGSTHNLGTIIGRDGTDGKEIDVSGIYELIESIKTKSLSNGQYVVPMIDETAPDDVASKVAKAVGILSESPSIIQPQQPMVLNIATPAQQAPRSKRITTRRDENGNLVAEVTEI